MEHLRRNSLPDPAFVTAVRRVTWIGFWINLLLASFKIFAGYFGNSRAVVADGVHSLSDLITDVALLLGVKYWVAPADENHPYGHKRLESLVSLSIGLFLGFAGVGIAYDAALRFFSPVPAEAGSLLALGAAAASVVSKEALYRWTLVKGRELKSAAVEANAWDHRSDVMSSLPVMLAVALAMWFPSLAVLDQIGAAVVAVFILRAAWKICRPALNELLDEGAGPELRARILAKAAAAPGVCGVHSLRTRYVGQSLLVDMHVSVDPNMTVAAAHEIADALEALFFSDETEAELGLEIADVLVHIEPWSESLPSSKP